jgi:hypothetical protein
VTLISKSSDLWWLIRTDAGEEGYAYAQYLSPKYNTLNNLNKKGYYMLVSFFI